MYINKPSATKMEAADSVKATFHLTISMCGQRGTGKIQRNNYRHGSCGPSLTGKMSSVSLIFMHATYRNVKGYFSLNDFRHSDGSLA